MAKKYTRKNVRSLEELDLEQDRIRYKMARMEDDMLGFFDPQQLAITAVKSFLSNRMRRKEKETPQRFSTAKKKKANNKASEAKGKVAELVSNPAVKKILKKVGISFLQWQAFNLALYLGKTIVRKVKEKKAAQKMENAAGAA